VPSTVEQINPTRAKITIEMPFAELEPALQDAYQQIAGQVNLPGFRKGKVPPKLIDQRFGRGVVLQEAINAVIPDAYAKAIEEHKLAPLGQPEIDIQELADGEKVVFTAELDVRPDFKIADPAKVKVQVPNARAIDEAMDDQTLRLRESFATFNPLERGAQDGDVAEFDIVATKDGKSLDDADAKGMRYKVGTGGMLEGLDEALAGLQVGESKAFKSTLIGGKHKGVEADIEVTLTGLSEEVLPDLDDDFAQMISRFDTLDELLADLREAMGRAAEFEQFDNARELVLAELIKQTEFELPEKLIEAQVEGARDSVNQQLAQRGLTLDDYLAESDEEAETAEEFWELLETNTVEGLRARILLEKYADDKEIGIEQDDFFNLLNQKAQQAGTSPEQEMQHMLEHGHQAEWFGEIRRGKALEQLVLAATITDEDGKVLEFPELRRAGDATDTDSAETPAADDQSAEKQPAAKKKAAKDTDDAEPAAQPAKPKATKAKAKAAEADAADEA